MLVQVERTGADQRASGFIHADDVKEWLLTAGFDEAEIAIKTAEQNDLSQPENQDLLSPTNRVRAIITKSALQEGWDSHASARFRAAMSSCTFCVSASASAL